MAQLLPSPGITWHLKCSGTSVHSVSGCVPPLCVSHFFSFPPSDFQYPDPSWCQAALPALVREGASDLTLLQLSCRRHPAGGHRALGPTQNSETLPSQCSPFIVCFSMSSAIFVLQISHKLRFLWLFTLFLRRLARCSNWAQGELGSALNYLGPIFQIGPGKITNNLKKR